ncbi:chromatin accessibility complex protein 1 [Protopterus annectens]|uniref:chromatin accessibility complex protein 1 n=1 Tax=Protopterus annectens TaxID=7888 RepID=UPI001CFA97AB|nr:chromatin accessibility complex protein 1 [Protopterus annectens]
MADYSSFKRYDKPLEHRSVLLPLSRVKLIMKSSSDVSNINQDALFLTAKATEMFVQYLAKYSYKNGTGKERKELVYSDLSNTVAEADRFQFLGDILPKKILARDYFKLLQQEEEGEASVTGQYDNAEEEEESGGEDDDDDDDEEYEEEEEEYDGTE